MIDFWQDKERKEDDDEEDDDDKGDDEERRRKKKTRTVFSRSQVCTGTYSMLCYVMIMSKWLARHIAALLIPSLILQYIRAHIKGTVA